jgi:hypothetical protein
MFHFKREKKRFSYYRWLKRSIRDLVYVLTIYLLIAYLILPLVWRHYESEPALESAPKMTENAFGLPGDPLNIALIGSKEDLLGAMVKAGWQPADQTTLRSSISIATSVLLNRSYPTAPMSKVYLWDRPQDLAFERLTTKSPRQRHHVRFWQSPLKTKDGRPLWIGAATYDIGIGFSRFTGQITHHIAPDVDAEREQLMRDLTLPGQLQEMSQVTGIGASIAGRNQMGDWYFTDGELAVGILTPRNAVRTEPPAVYRNPPAVDWKNQGWLFLRSVFAQYGTL